MYFERESKRSNIILNFKEARKIRNDRVNVAIIGTMEDYVESNVQNKLQ
jgi:hypothetical protein